MALHSPLSLCLLFTVLGAGKQASHNRRPWMVAADGNTRRKQREKTKRRRRERRRRRRRRAEIRESGLDNWKDIKVRRESETSCLKLVGIKTWGVDVLGYTYAFLYMTFALSTRIDEHVIVLFPFLLLLLLLLLLFISSRKYMSIHSLFFDWPSNNYYYGASRILDS